MRAKFLALAAVAALPLSLWARDPGPIAISMTTANAGVVLQSDGRLIAFDANSNDQGKVLFRVPNEYLAADVATGSFGKGAVTCLTLNAKSASKYASFVLQLLPDGKQVWAWMPDRGVYIGVAVDAAAGVAYATNSSNSGVYRVKLGQEKGAVVEIARIIEAERLGAVALDQAGQRLFIADQVMGRLFVLPLASKSGATAIPVPGAEEIRAVAWSPVAKRVFVADAAQEAVWSVDPARPDNPVRIRDKRLREPAGLTVTRDGHVWLVDEGAHSVFQLSPQNMVVRAVKWK